ncbi:MAG: hypothetical protein GY725_01880 [bacterium]|nr:hypothetical protein [bacterium]
MSKIHETITDQRNFPERIIQSIPGFRGYFDRENRREADSLLRDFGVTRLDFAISELHSATKAAALEDMSGIQELVNQVEKLRNELRHSDRGYAAFFQEIKWDGQEMLEQLYEQDRSVVQGIETVETMISSGEFGLSALRSEVKTLGRALEDRENAILRLAAE